MFFKPNILHFWSTYNRGRFFKDIFAGITVGIVALPLSIAFAIASGLKPEQGIFTAIIAGGLIAMLGGSRMQIGGPAGAFIIIVYGIVDRYGVANLMLTTCMSGMILFLMGLLRLGTLIRYIPVAVIIGFTNGIALLIALSQIKEFVGLRIEKVPAEFFELIASLYAHRETMNVTAFGVAIGTLVFLIGWKKIQGKSAFFQLVPGAVLAMLGATLVSSLFDFELATIGSRFGGIPGEFPAFRLLTFELTNIPQLIGPAITLAFLGAIESLLCARVADRLVHGHHDSNQELLGQGIANFVVPFFGGMPATGTIARTVTNIQSGGNSPIAGLVHCMTLVVIILFAAPLAQHIPLASLAAILMFIAWHMGEWSKLFYLRKFRWPYRATLLSVFFLTVLVDLTIAIQVGLLCAFVTLIYRVASLSKAHAVKVSQYSQLHGQSGIVDAYRISGAVFFGTTYLLNDIERHLPSKYLVLDFHNVLYTDTSGMDALQELSSACDEAQVRLILCGLNAQVFDLIERLDFIKPGLQNQICTTLEEGINEALKNSSNTQKPLEESSS